ncbi:hypothetical protein F5Y05DRAFT_395075 [Hypoxylon sp. FL0543]|nr:hypothetical protein F5Y05DRAFT_395075 [Hypoxylon sp. FL0543]
MYLYINICRSSFPLLQTTELGQYSCTWFLVGASGPVSSARSTVKICKFAKAAVSSLCFGPRDCLAAQEENPQSGNTKLLNSVATKFRIVSFGVRANSVHN